MRTTPKSLVLAASLAALGMPGAAQSSSAAHPNTLPQTPAAQQPKRHPQKGIAKGVSGKVTGGEAASLERKEGGGNAEDRDMREDNRGRLTSADRAKLRHQQNRVSKSIHHDQHHPTLANARSKSTAGQNANKQAHAAQFKTGQLTTRQATHVETKKSSLHREIHSDREQEGGKRTPEN
jgi:hypothetical protein